MLLCLLDHNPEHTRETTCTIISLEGEARLWVQVHGEPAGLWDIGTAELGGQKSRACRGSRSGGDNGRSLAWTASTFTTLGEPFWVPGRGVPATEFLEILQTHYCPDLEKPLI